MQVDAWSDQGGTAGGGVVTTGRTGAGEYNPNAYVCAYVPQVNSGGYEHVAEPPAEGGLGSSMNKICGRAAEVAAARSQADPARWFTDNCTTVPSQGCGATYGLWVDRPAPTPAEVAQTLRDTLNISRPDLLHTSPESEHLFVRFPTWFWVTGGPGVAEPKSKSVGNVRVDATPSFTWDTGDGPVSCTGKGTPYVQSLYAADAESPTCGHSYRRPGWFTLTLRVTWTFTWYLNGVEQTDPALAPTILTVSQDVGVNEIQGVVTNVR